MLQRIVLWVLVVSVSGACATAPPSEEIPDAETYYNDGLKKLQGDSFLFFDDVDYKGAIENFQDVIDNYPYSEFATLAELKIADVHFEQGNFDEASSYYQDFVELHPAHERVPYAIYQNGICHYEQIGDSDQDQGPSKEALAQFQALLEKYPESDYAKESNARLSETVDRLANHDVEVADFYYGTGEFHAAARRYKTALETFPQHSRRQRTMARLGFSLLELRRYYEAEAVLRQVMREEPDDFKLVDAIQWALEEIETTPRFGPRRIKHSCATDPNPACESFETDALPLREEAPERSAPPEAN